MWGDMRLPNPATAAAAAVSGTSDATGTGTLTNPLHVNQTPVSKHPPAPAPPPITLVPGPVVAGPAAPVCGEDAAEAAFAKKLAKFEAADANFQLLAQRLADYRAAAIALTDAGVRLADTLTCFFKDKHPSLSSSVPAPSVSSSSISSAPSAKHNMLALATSPFHSPSLSSSSVATAIPSAVASHAGTPTTSFASFTASTPHSNVLQNIHPHVVLPAAFRDALHSMHATCTHDLIPRFDEQVVRPVQACLQQFPEVRSYIKQRSAAQAELQKRTKRLTARSGSVPPESLPLPQRGRDRDRQRKFREVSDRYKMFDDQVMQRFSYIDRTQPALVLPPLRKLAALLHEFARVALATLRPVADLATADAPPLTRDITPPPWCETPLHHNSNSVGCAPSPSSLTGNARSEKGGTTVYSNNACGNGGSRGAVVEEGWDDSFDFDDSAFVPVTENRTSGNVTSVSLASGIGSPKGVDSSSPAGVTSRLEPPPLPQTSHPDVALPDSVTSSCAAENISDPRRIKSSGPSTVSVASAGTNDHLSAVPEAKTSRAVPISAPPVLSPSDDGCDNWEQESRSERQSVLMRLCAEHDFNPVEMNELQLRAGDIIEVYEKHHSGWWQGRANHVTGYFPRCYARELTEEEEVEYLTELSRRRKDRRKGHRRRESYDSKQSGQSFSQASTTHTSPNTLSPGRKPCMM